MKESDLYIPVKRFLESQGYQVKGEVHDCDIVAVRELEPPVIVELKQTLNLDVVLQAVDRLNITDKVYVGVYRKGQAVKKRRKQIVKLLKMVGLGLLLIDPELKTGSVEVIHDPLEYKPRKMKSRRERLLGEFVRRVGDPNLGGSAKRKGLMTAYRQRTIAIAKYLKQEGPAKASHVAAIVEDPKTRDILYRDVYGWFDKVSRGIYNISPRGKKELSVWCDDGEAIEKSQ